MPYLWLLTVCNKIMKNNKKWPLINFGVLYIFITPVKRCVQCVRDFMIVGEQMLLRSHCFLWSVEVFVQQLHCPQSLWLSSTEVNSSISSCQTIDLKELSAAGNILSHDETVLKGAAIDSRVWTCVHPPDPLQSSPRPLPYPVYIGGCHVEPRCDTWHLHCLSRCFHLRWRLVQFDLTPNSCKEMMNMIQQTWKPHVRQVTK